MTWIDLGDPSPKAVPDRYAPIGWPLGEVCQLTPFWEVPNRSLGEVFEARVSHREFGLLGEKELSAFLWIACRTRGVGPSELGFDLEHRAAPSAGAIHPIHIVVKRPADDRWWLYESRAHHLVELKYAHTKLSGLYEASCSVLDAELATRFLFLAEHGKTLAKYQDGCSLIWRDAGALLGVMALTAAALDLNFCPLGITGEPWAATLSDQGKLAGVGLALLGAPLGR